MKAGQKTRPHLQTVFSDHSSRYSQIHGSLLLASITSNVIIIGSYIDLVYFRVNDLLVKPMGQPVEPLIFFLNKLYIFYTYSDI
jgi:hypothetical protein